MKVILDRSYTLEDAKGNPHGFGPGEADVPNELMPKLEAAAARRKASIEKIAEGDGIVKTAIPATPNGDGSFSGTLNAAKAEGK